MADQDQPAAGSMQQGERLEEPAPKRARTDEKPPPMLPITVDFAEQRIRSIVADASTGPPLWTDDMETTAIDTSEFERYRQTRNELLDENGLLMTDALVEKLVALGGGVTQGEIQVGCQDAVQLANSTFLEPGYFGEMVLQQCVYSRLTMLLYTVSLVITRMGTMYAADQAVGTAHLVKTASVPSKTFLLECTPDAAIRMHPMCYCLAMMEIKAKVAVDLLDMARCVLMLSASALALQEALGKETLANELGFPCFFPFVIGSGTQAKLYAVRLGKDGDLKVVFVSIAFMSANEERIGLTADLLALVLPLARLARKFRVSFEGFKKLTKQEADHNFSSLESPTRPGGRTGMASRPSEQKAPESGPDKDRSDEAHATLAGLARFSRLRQYDVRSSWRQSPYYFLGDLDDRPVFCKVWRDGDPSLRGIQGELKMLQKAHECGVPSPAIVRTRTGVSHSTIDGQQGHKDKWHVVIMEYLRTDTVTVNQIRAMSLSLIRAVQKLHEHGLLHCDIKPRNLAWDSEQEHVYLLDFGHAQEVHGAESYRATEGFEAPEIVANQPHSRASEAYSVGATIESFFDNMPYHRQSDPDSSLVLRVAAGLTRMVAEERLTLAQAEEMLMEVGQLAAET